MLITFAIVSYRTGLTGFHRYLTRFFIWRCSAGWVAFLLIGIPLVFYAGAAWKGTLLTDPFPFSSLSAFLLALPLAVIKGPVEEFGWRGFACPSCNEKWFRFWPQWFWVSFYDTIILTGIAILVVWLNRQTMFTKATAHVETVPPKSVSRPEFKKKVRPDIYLPLPFNIIELCGRARTYIQAGVIPVPEGWPATG